MQTIELDLLCQTRDLLYKLLDRGQCFTMIEIDPNDFSIKGENFRDEIERLLRCINDYENSIDFRSIKHKCKSPKGKK